MGERYNVDYEIKKTIRTGKEAGRTYRYFAKNLLEKADRASKVIKEFEARFS